MCGGYCVRGLRVCVCPFPCFLPPRNNAPNMIYQRLQSDMSKVLMLRSGVKATFGYAAKSAIFCYTQFPVPCTCTVLTIAAVVPHIFNYVLMNIINLGAHVLFCLFVCQRLFSHYRLRGGLRAIPTASVLQGQENQCCDFAETTAFERYGVKTSEKNNMHNEHWLTSTRFSPFSAPWTN